MVVERPARVCVCTSNCGTTLEATFSQPGLRLDRCDQRSGPHDVDDAGEIVGEDVKRHLGGHAWQPLHQEVGCSHPRLERPERMLDRLAPLAHFFRVLVEPTLDGFENMLLLPARDPSLLAGGAAVLEGAALADVGPVAAQDQPVRIRRSCPGTAASVDLRACWNAALSERDRLDSVTGK